MLMTGKRIEIAQLPSRDHADKIFLMPRQSNLIGILAPAKKIGLRMAKRGLSKSDGLKSPVYARWDSRSSQRAE
jgi:hypothetical protein